MESTQKSQNAHEFLMNTLNKISRLGHLMEVQATNLTAKKVTGKDLSQVEVQTRVINKIKLICSVAKENLDAIELNAQDWLDSGGVLDEDSDSDAPPQVVDTTLHKPQNSSKTQVPNGNIPSLLNASVSESDGSETSRLLSKSCIYISESDVENNTTVGKQLNAIGNEDATIVSPSVSENETNKTKTRVLSSRQQELSVENGEESATIGDEKSRSDSEKEINSKTTETRDKHLDDNGDSITGVENSTCDSEKTTPVKTLLKKSDADAEDSTEDNKKTVNGNNTVDGDTEFKPVLKCVDINKLIDSRLKKTSLPDDDVIVIEDESPVKAVIETVGTRSRSDKRVSKNLSTTRDTKQKRYNKKFYMKCAVNVSRCELHLDRLMKKSKIRKLYDGKRNYYYYDKHSVGGAISEKRKSRSVSSKTRSNRTCSSDDSFKEFNPRKKKRLENCTDENSSTPLVAAKSNLDKKDDSDSELETRPPQLDTEDISDLFDELKSGSKKKSKDSNEDSAKSKKKTDIEKNVTGKSKHNEKATSRDGSPIPENFKSKNNEKATSRDGSPIPKNSKSKKTADHSNRDSSLTAKESGEENSKSREQSDKLKAKNKSSHRTSKEERESRLNIQNNAKQDLLNSTNSDSNNENAMVTTHLKESRKKLRKTRSERDKKSKLRSSESEKKNKSDTDTLNDDRQCKMSAESEDLNENIENSESGKGKKKKDRSNSNVSENEKNTETKNKKKLKNKTKKKRHSSSSNVSENEKNSETKGVEESKKKRDSGDSNVTENEDTKVSDRSVSEIEENSDTKVDNENELKKKTKKKRDSGNSNVSENEENLENKGDKEHKQKSDGSSRNDSENEDNPENDANIHTKSKKELIKNTKSKKGTCDNGNISENENNIEETKNKRKLKKTKKKRDSDKSNVSENEENSEPKVGSSASENEDNVLTKNIQELGKKTKKKRESDNSNISENEENVETASKQKLKKKTKPKRDSGGDSNVSENEDNSETKADSIVSENEDNVDTISKQDLKKKTKSKRDSGDRNVSENEDDSETKADSIVSENEDNVESISKDLKKKTKSKRDSGGDSNVSENEDNSESKADSIVSENEDNVETIDLKKKTKSKRDSGDHNVSENEDNSESKEDKVLKKKTKKKRKSSNSSDISLDARTSLNASPSGSGVDEASSKMAEKSSKKEMGRKKNSHTKKTDENKDISDSDNSDREIDRLTDLKSLKSHKRHRSQTSNSDTEPNGIEDHDDNSKNSKSSSRKSKKKARKVSENNIDDHPNSDDSDKQNSLDDSDKRNNSDLDDIPISNLASKVGLNAKIVEELLASSDDDVVQNSESDCDKKKKDKKTKNKDTAETSGSKNGNTEDKSGDSLDDAKSRDKWRKDKLLTEKLSETDTSDEERLIKKMKEKCKDLDDTFTDTPIVKKKQKTTRRRVLGSDSDAENKSNNSDDDNKNSNKSDSDQNADDMDDDKSKNSDSDSDKKTKKRKAKKKRSSSDNSDDSSATEKRKKRKRIKRIKDSDDSSDDDKDSPSKGRKNIRKVMKDESLEYATKRAAKEEQERKKRLEERQRLYNEMFDVEKADSAMKLDKLVLDFDPETKEEFVKVHKKLVKKLKPHQASGVKFMWNACFESLKQVKKTKGSGCILAHCMGLGKTLQVVTLIHTLITNHKTTGVRCVLVCCPLSTVLNWVNEFHIWLKNINDGEDVSVFELSKFKNNYERVYQIKEWQDCGGVLVLGYDMFRNLCSEKGGRYKKKQRETLQKCLVDPGPDLVVCDEGHLLKNEKTSISQAMTKIKTLRRIVMTGTPVQNNLKEYYCMVQFVKPNLLGKYTEYMNRFVNPITNGQYTDSTDRDISIMKKRSHVLHKMLDGCVQRQDYGVLAPFLPPKHEYVVFISLTDMQINLYNFYLENISRRPQPGGKGTGFLFPDFQNFQRIWTHPLALRANSDKYDKNQAKKREQEESDESEGSLKDFIDDDDDDEDSDAASSSGSGSSSDNAKKKDKSGVNARNTRATRRGTRANPLDKDIEPEATVKDEVKAENPTEWWMPLCPAEELENLAHSNKLLILFSILKECEAIGDKVLVFSQSLYSLDVIEHFLEKVDESTQKNEDGEEHLGKHTGSWALGLDYFRLDGSSSCENRAIWCKTFNQASNVRARLFLISTRAGGLGINLVAANRVIIFDVSWNPSHDIQSIFRVYRFGQTKPCYIYRFLAMGTMEEKIYERQVTKQAISKRVIDEQQIDRHYKENDLQELYNFEPVMDAPRELPNLPKDRLFAELLKAHESIYKYHEHDSLLENKEEETLDEAERKAAWEEFENEKNRPPPPPNMGTTMTGTSGMLFGLRTDLVLNLVTIMLKKDNPKLNDQIIRNMIPTVIQRMTAGDYSLVTRMHATLQELQASVIGSSSGVYNPFANMNNMMNAPAPGNIPMMANTGRPMPTWMNQQQQQHQQRQQQLLMQQRYQQQQPMVQPMAAPAQGMNYTQSVLAMQTANMAPNPLAIAKGKGKPPKRKAPRLLETVDLDSD